MNELEPVLKFIYLGQCEAYPADFEGFIETARLLGVAGLDDTPIGNSKDKTNNIQPESCIAEDADTKENIAIKPEFNLDFNHKQFNTIGAFYGDECEYGFNKNIAVRHHMEGYHKGAGSHSDRINLKSVRKDSSEENAMSQYKESCISASNLILMKLGINAAYVLTMQRGCISLESI